MRRSVVNSARVVITPHLLELFRSCSHCVPSSSVVPFLRPLKHSKIPLLVILKALMSCGISVREV